MSDDKPFAFVLMPFEKAFDDIYKLGIQASATEHDVVAQRVDEQIYSDTMLVRIYRQIEAADFIIADMTGRNENVFYEVGYAHAKGKLCTLLTQDASDIPFDLKQHRHLVYGTSIQTLKSLLSLELQWLKAESLKRKTSAITISHKKPWAYISKSESSDRANFHLTFDIHNTTENKSPHIEAIYLYTGKGWTFTQGEDECASTTSDLALFKSRHFIKSPLNKLPPSAWGQVKLTGSKMVWNSFGGFERKEEYDLSGVIMIAISTSDGIFTEKINIDLKATEFPF